MDYKLTGSNTVTQISSLFPADEEVGPTGDIGSECEDLPDLAYALSPVPSSPPQAVEEIT